MVKEVVDAIKAAEKKAESIIEESKAKARAASTQAKAEIAEKTKKIEQDAQKEYGDMIAKAEAFARKRAQMMITTAEERFVGQNNTARGNIDKAVQFILGRIS